MISAERGKGQLGELIADDDDVAVAAVTIAELRVGVELASVKAKPARQAFLEDVLMTVQVLDYDLKVAHAHAGLLVAMRRQGRPRGAHDLIIAATARAHGRQVVSADRAAFADLPGVSVVSVGPPVPEPPT